MNQPTPYEIARLALVIQSERRDDTQSTCLQTAYNLWDNARLCIVDNEIAEKKDLIETQEKFKKRVDENLRIIHEATGRKRVE